MLQKTALQHTVLFRFCKCWAWSASEQLWIPKRRKLQWSGKSCLGASVSFRGASVYQSCASLGIETCIFRRSSISTKNPLKCCILNLLQKSILQYATYNLKQEKQDYRCFESPFKRPLWQLECILGYCWQTSESEWIPQSNKVVLHLLPLNKSRFKLYSSSV